MACKVLCIPKCEGGLDLKKVEVWNKVLLYKQLWAIQNKQNRLWVKWIQEYYLQGVSIWMIETKLNSSWCWKHILRVRDGLMPAGLIYGFVKMLNDPYFILVESRPKVIWSRFVWNKDVFPMHGFVV